MLWQNLLKMYSATQYFCWIDKKCIQLHKIIIKLYGNIYLRRSRYRICKISFNNIHHYTLLSALTDFLRLYRLYRIVWTYQHQQHQRTFKECNFFILRLLKVFLSCCCCCCFFSFHFISLVVFQLTCQLKKKSYFLLLLFRNFL